MRKAKNAKNSDCIKNIEVEVEKYRKKREERIKLSRIQTESEGTGQCWNTEFYSSK
ncbi:hypothetical protein G9F71_008920 [Clostridium sp. FP2]|uniref:hypothetical protein n=1 Tax=Clostridium sp. FP2 TaxID=2724481 RepID=UPI0013E91706|nr:hypothetical protein [Clostridium sp. FP2]MBZ9622976.1 hypothetical protein [Clostridium sp. FP2]